MNFLKAVVLTVLLIFVQTCYASVGNLKIDYGNKPLKGSAVENTQTSSTPVLSGGVSKLQELPKAMYGIWKVEGTLLETNTPDVYLQTTSDIWVLSQSGPIVTISNPKNGATASITINEVINNTATFSRQISGYNRKETEQVTITVNGDIFTGTDTIISETSSWAGSSLVMTSKYRIKGTRQSGNNFNTTSKFWY
ncbi:MAG: hypothetical protein PHX18_03255 [Candidatus Gastranaerophilales bacterium]|nr:hypothetical protein [Candidatus Gastranaerophilales bacterium]